MAPSQMDRATMLDILTSEGENAGSDYNDSERVHGRFGWSIEPDGNGGGVLSVTYEDQEDEDHEPITLRWVLTPMGLQPVPPVEAVVPPAVEHTEGTW